MPTTAPNSCCCARPGRSPGCRVISRSGRRRVNTGRVASASASWLPDADRRASASGRYGTVSASSAQRPDRMVNPRCTASAASSVSSLVLPTPASPLTSSTTGWPASASLSSSRIRPSSAALPTSAVPVGSGRPESRRAVSSTLPLSQLGRTVRPNKTARRVGTSAGGPRSLPCTGCGRAAGAHLERPRRRPGFPSACRAAARPPRGQAARPGCRGRPAVRCGS